MGTTWQATTSGHKFSELRRSNAALPGGAMRAYEGLGAGRIFRTGDGHCRRRPSSDSNTAGLRALQ